MRIDLSDISLVQQLLDICRRLYQHETCSPEMRTYIRFELGKAFPKLDVIGFLRDTDYSPESWFID